MDRRPWSPIPIFIAALSLLLLPSLHGCGGEKKDSAAGDGVVFGEQISDTALPDKPLSLGSENDAVSLNIPAGAVARQVEVTARPFSGKMADGRVAAGVEFGPEGMKLSKPATVVLRLPQTLARGTLVSLHYLGGSQASWSPATTGDGTEILAMVRPDGHSVVIAVDHFSKYAVLEDTIRQVDDAMRTDTRWRPGSQTQSGKVELWMPADFNPDTILNGFLPAAWAGLRDDTTRRALYKEAIVALVEQPDMLESSALQGGGSGAELASAVLAALKIPRTSLRMIDAREGGRGFSSVVMGGEAKDDLLRAIRDYALKWDKHSTLKNVGAHLKNLADRLDSVSAAVSAAGVVFNLEEDVFRAMLIHSLEDALVENRLEALAGAVRKYQETRPADFDPQMNAAFDDARREITGRKNDYWRALSDQLAQDSAGKYVLPAASLAAYLAKSKAIMLVLPKYSNLAGLSRAAGAAGSLVGIAEQLYGFHKDVRGTGYAACVLTLMNGPLGFVDTWNVSQADFDRDPRLLHLSQMRTYAAYEAYKIIGESYSGDIIQLGARVAVTEILKLVGYQGWSKERLYYINTARDKFAALYSRLAAAALEAGETPAADALPASPIILAPAATMKRDALGKMVPSICFSPDGIVLASTMWDDRVILWDVAGRRQIATLRGDKHIISSVCFSPDGKTLAVADYGKIVLWDVASQQKTGALADADNYIWFMAFSPDGKTIACANLDKTVNLWRVADGRRMARLTAAVSGLGSSLSFSPDGTLLVAACQNVIIVWDVSNPSEAVIVGEKAMTCLETPVSFSPDGKMIAVGGEPFKKSVTLLEVPSLREIASFEKFTMRTRAMSFSPDGRLIAAGGIPDCIIKVWNVAALREVAELRGHTEAISCLSFSPDGNMLASAAFDGTIRLWDLSALRK